MPESSQLYKRVRIHFKSGTYRDFCLTQEEILSISAVVYNSDGLRYVTLYYSGTDEDTDQLAHLIAADSIEHIEIDDTYYTMEGLALRGLSNLRIYEEPSKLKLFWEKFKREWKSYSFKKKTKEVPKALAE